MSCEVGYAVDLHKIWFDRWFCTKFDLERGESGGRLLLRDVRKDGRAAASIEIAKATPERSGGFARIVRTGSRVVIAWTDMTAGPTSKIAVAAVEVQ